MKNTLNSVNNSKLFAKLLTICLAILAFACSKEDVPTADTPTSTPIIAKSSAKDITKFSFAALSPVVDATIDVANKTISATLPSSFDLTKLVPTITVSEKATISPASGVAQDFSNEVSYTVTAEDGSTAVWKVGVKKEVEVNNITSDDKIIFGSWDGKVYSLDAGKGTIKWDFDTGWTGMHKTDYFNGMALVGSTGKLISIDINTGIKKWEFLSNTEKGVFASGATVVNNIAYIGCNDFFVYAINATTGIKIWEFKTGGYNQSKPFVVNNIVYIGSLDKKVYAIDALTGLKKWDYTLGGATTNSPTVSDGILYIGSEDKKIHAIDAITGEKKWEFLTGNKIFSCSPIVAEGIVYIGSSDFKLYALDAKTGIKKWDFLASSKFLQSPIFVNGVIYAGADKLYALDAKTGSIKWSQSNAMAVPYSEIAHYKGWIFVGFGNTMQAHDANTGTKKWAFTTGSDIYSSPFIVDKNGNGYK